MYVYILRRVLLLIPVIIGVMTITFLIVQGISVPERVSSYYVCSGHGGVSPCQPTIPCKGSTTGAQCPNPAYQAAVHQLGYDQPVIQQWGTYIANSLSLHWGYTGANSEASNELRLTGQTPVSTVLSYFLPYTLELASISLVFILALSIPIGNYSAVYRNRPVDQLARVLSFSGFALPGFLLATLAIAAATLASSGSGLQCNGTEAPFGLWFGSWPKETCFASGAYPSWIGSYQQTSPTGFPTVDAAVNGNWALALDSLRRMLIPALVITYGGIAGILRFVRNSMLEVMNLDFIRTARSKGVPEARVVKRHAGRNSLNVTVTVLGLTFAGFIGGFPIIEYIFGLRGIGLTLVYAIQPQFDYGLIFGTTLLFTIIVVAANICVDILYAYLDPRVRLG
ncbi:MAG TPA: ABC transporter permease [Thermoplasmata archaeon]|nr:ABC transporter permease [Thermoplasmata archaeon]